MHMGEPIYFPPMCYANEATVGLIASPLSHLPGLACNEIEAFG